MLSVRYYLINVLNPFRSQFTTNWHFKHFNLFVTCPDLHAWSTLKFAKSIFNSNIKKLIHFFIVIHNLISLHVKNSDIITDVMCTSQLQNWYIILMKSTRVEYAHKNWSTYLGSRWLYKHFPDHSHHLQSRLQWVDLRPGHGDRGMRLQVRTKRSFLQAPVGSDNHTSVNHCMLPCWRHRHQGRNVLVGNR